MCHPRPLFVYFRSIQTNNAILYKKLSAKMSIHLRCWNSNSQPLVREFSPRPQLLIILMMQICQIWQHILQLCSEEWILYNVYILMHELKQNSVLWRDTSILHQSNWHCCWCLLMVPACKCKLIMCNKMSTYYCNLLGNRQSSKMFPTIVVVKWSKLFPSTLTIRVQIQRESTVFIL